MRSAVLAGTLVLFTLAPRITGADCLDSLATKFIQELAVYEAKKCWGEFEEFKSPLPKQVTWEMACAVFDTLNVPKTDIRKIKNVWERDKEFRNSLQYLILFFEADKLDSPEKAESTEEMAKAIREVVASRAYASSVTYYAKKLLRAGNSCSEDEMGEIIEKLQEIKWDYEAECGERDEY